jgi:SAM-dependent methyltransferase
MMRWDVVAGLLANPTAGAELGAHAGKFTEQMLAAFPRLLLFAVDTWAVTPGYEHYDFPDIRRAFVRRTGKFGKRVKPLHMDTVSAALEVKDASLDFVFIDADHSYAGVAADIDAWRYKVKPGGILCGHDYGHPRFPGVKQAVDERFTVQTGDDHVWWVRC